MARHLCFTFQHLWLMKDLHPLETPFQGYMIKFMVLTLMDRNFSGKISPLLNYHLYRQCRHNAVGHYASPPCHETLSGSRGA